MSPASGVVGRVRVGLRVPGGSGVLWAGRMAAELPSTPTASGWAAPQKKRRTG